MSASWLSRNGNAADPMVVVVVVGEQQLGGRSRSRSREGCANCSL